MTFVLPRSIADWPWFLRYVWQRSVRDACVSVAASLSFTSLLALVPLTAIGLAMFAAFPAFSDLRADVVSWAFFNLTPRLGGVMQTHLQTYVENAGRTTGFGVLALALTAILMLNTIQTAFDRIWEGRRRPRLSRLLVYWALITLGPILFGLSFSVSGYVLALARTSGVIGISDGIQFLGIVMPFILQTAGFGLFYRLVPTRSVRVTDAAAGAVIAGLLFEGLKHGFGYYLGHVAGLEAVYGALAAIPAFLVWMYLAWLAVLTGAEVAAALPEWRSGRRGLDDRPRRGDLLGLGLGVVHALALARTSDGTGRHPARLTERLRADPEKLQGVLESLKAAGIVVRDELGRFHLARELDRLGLTDVIAALDLSLGRAERCPPELAARMERLNRAEGAAFAGTVAEWLAQERQSDPGAG